MHEGVEALIWTGQGAPNVRRLQQEGSKTGAASGVFRREIVVFGFESTPGSFAARSRLPSVPTAKAACMPMFPADPFPAKIVCQDGNGETPLTY